VFAGKICKEYIEGHKNIEKRRERKWDEMKEDLRSLEKE